MTSRQAGGPLLGAAVALGLGAWIVAAQGPLPGDVWITRGAQAIFGSHPSWAELLTKSATEPFMWALAAVTAALASVLYGWRPGIATLLSFAVSLTLDRALRALLHAPRPAASLVEVVRPSDTSGLPSTFGLVYGATIGLLVVLGWKARTPAARAACWTAMALLVAGLLARVTMGGHWASQVAASYAAAMVLAYAVALLVEPARKSAGGADRAA